MMRRTRIATMALMGIVAAGLTDSSIAAERNRPTPQSWLDTRISAEQRADALLRAMTLEEKAGQVSQQFMFGKFE